MVLDEHEPHLGGTERAAEVAVAPVGGDEVVEHARRDLMWVPRSEGALGNRGVDTGAGVERLKQYRRAAAEMSDDEVARQSDPGQRNPGGASHFDVDDRQEDRQAGSS